MRSVTVHMVRGGDSSTLADTVRVRSWVSKVGRTSWQSATEILSHGAGPAPGELVARAVTTMVAMDDELEKTAAVPAADELRELVREAPDVLSTVVVKPPPRPDTDDGVYVWATTVRLTDCDSFGHVTNTKYPTMALEARAICAKARRPIAPDTRAPPRHAPPCTIATPPHLSHFGCRTSLHSGRVQSLPRTSPWQEEGYSATGNQLALLNPTGCHVDYIRQIREAEAPHLRQAATKLRAHRRPACQRPASAPCCLLSRCGFCVQGRSSR
eukprot:1909767-Prymnesium_polylepis.3